MTSGREEASVENKIHVLKVSPEHFRVCPQIGRPCQMTWSELGAYLSRPIVGDSKGQAGAWSPAMYRGNVRRKSALVSVGALVVDIDEAGDVDNAANIVGRYDAIVHETFSSTNDSPRCRIVLRLAEAIDAATYETLHKVVRAHLAAAGIVVDEGAKDASRLSYAPVRRRGAGYRFRQVDGLPLNANGVLAAHPAPKPRPVHRPVAPHHRDAYARGALRRAAHAVLTAGEGSRHFILCKEAHSLARLGLSESDIANALLPSFIAAAGEGRELEGRRAIRDAVRARLGVA